MSARDAHIGGKMRKTFRSFPKLRSARRTRDVSLINSTNASEMAERVRAANFTRSFARAPIYGDYIGSISCAFNYEYTLAFETRTEISEQICECECSRVEIKDKYSRYAISRKYDRRFAFQRDGSRSNKSHRAHVFRANHRRDTRELRFTSRAPQILKG